MNNVKLIPKAHPEPVRGVSFAPTDLKFCTGSDDTTIKVWDFARCHQECVLAGHGGDVKGLEWHPYSSVIASASKDALTKLWDARTGSHGVGSAGKSSSASSQIGNGCVATLYGHKGSVLACRWNSNGNWLLTGARDQVIKLWDVRMLREINTFRGHVKEITALAWHPSHEKLFVSGSYSGEMCFWLADSSVGVNSGSSGGDSINGVQSSGNSSSGNGRIVEPLEMISHAHEGAIWTVAWHPMGHVICTGSNDNTAKFW